MLMLAAMGEDDALWTRLLSKYGGDVDGAIALERLSDFVPMDPRVNLMMKAMVASVASVSERLERAQTRAQSQASSRANRIILNMRRQIIEPVLRAWAELVNRRHALGKRALRVALNGDLGRGWRQWRSVAAKAKATKARMSRVARRLLQQGLSRGWNAWCATHEAATRLRGIARRLVNPGVSRALNQWAQTTAELRERRRAARKGLARLVHREIVGCWFVWSEKSRVLTARLRGLRRCAARQPWRARSRTDRHARPGRPLTDSPPPLGGTHSPVTASRNHSSPRPRPALTPTPPLFGRRLMRRWVHRDVSRAFLRWESLLEDRAAMRRALSLALHASTGRAFRRWEESAEERRRLKGVAERVLRRMMRRVQAATFDAWADTVREQVRAPGLRARAPQRGLARRTLVPMDAALSYPWTWLRVSGVTCHLRSPRLCHVHRSATTSLRFVRALRTCASYVCSRAGRWRRGRGSSAVP